MAMRAGWIVAVLGCLAAGPAEAGWIVFARSGVQEIKGSIEVRGRQVRFHSLGGTLLSVRLEEVDLPASAFLTWQVGDTKTIVAPEGPPLAPKLMRPVTPPPRPARAAVAATGECAPAVVEQVVSAETLKIRSAGKLEVVHLACVDGPDLRHKFKDLDWYGRVAFAAVSKLAPAGAAICVGEDTPPRRDVEGHRVVYVRSPGGLDVGGEVIAGGLGLTRGESCARVGDYRELEKQARLEKRGHWGPDGAERSVQIAVASMAMYGGPQPLPPMGSGGG